MIWKQLINMAIEARGRNGGLPQLKYYDGASAEIIAAAEKRLGTAIPISLATLLRESDGIMNVLEIDGDCIETGWLIWNTERLVGENRAAAGDRRARTLAGIRSSAKSPSLRRCWC